MIRASAPGKVILFGEHAVVYGQPALAVPVTQVQATATITPFPEGSAAQADGPRGFEINLPDLERRYPLSAAAPDDVIAAAVRLTCSRAGVPAPSPSILRVESTIPIASGLGSGAAACTAVVRAVAQLLGCALTDAEVSSIVFETEKLLHGTPSGIDNTVVAYGLPVFFVKDQPPVPLKVAQPFQLLIGDTGVASPTRIAVGDVRAAWQKDSQRYNQLFGEIGAIVNEARDIIEDRRGDQPVARLGKLMNRNHTLLLEIGVSSPEIENLVGAARAAGAPGAKLSGAGRGGNMLALVSRETEAAVRAALERAGARRVLGTTVRHGTL